MNNSHIIHTYNFQTGKEGYFLILGPFCFYNTVTIISKQFSRIGTIGAMYGQSLTSSNKPKNVITRYWFATIGQVVYDLVTAFSKNHQFRILTGYWMLVRKNILFEIMNRLNKGLGCFNLISHHLKFLEVLEINILYG